MSQDYYDLLVFHEREVEALLKKLNLLEKVNAGQVMCVVCNKTITKENFGGVFKKENRVLVVCDDLQCVETARAQVDELKNGT